MSGRELKRLPPNQAGALYLEHSQQLMAFALGLLRNRELAREVVQVTFGKAIESAGQIPPENRKAWLFRVARNEAFAIRRREGVVQRAHGHLASGGGRSEAESQWPLEPLLKEEQVRGLQEALQRLPETQRQVVERRFYGDQTFPEIARELQLPIGTVLTRMRLALGRLEQILRSTEEQSGG